MVDLLIGFRYIYVFDCPSAEPGYTVPFADYVYILISFLSILVGKRLKDI